MVGWRFIVTAKPTSGSNPNACVPEGRPGGTLVEMSKTSDAMGSNMGAGQISQPRGNSRHGILSPHTGSPSGPFSIAPLRQSSPAHHPADESHLSICRRCVGLQSLCCARVRRERTKDPKSTADAAMRAPRRSIGVAMSRYSSLSVSPNFNNEQVRVFKLYATPHSLSYDACGIDNNHDACRPPVSSCCTFAGRVLGIPCSRSREAAWPSASCSRIRWRRIVCQSTSERSHE